MQIKKTGEEAKVPIDMTPMIDIVFQLLVFFIMTLNIASAEGDFNVKMPLSAPRAGAPDDTQIPPMKIRLIASNSGELTDIVLNDKSFGRPANLKDKGPWKNLHNYVASLVGDGNLRESAEVELDCDYNLHYAYVIEAITAVSGSLDANKNIVKLVEKIKFSPPRAEK